MSELIGMLLAGVREGTIPRPVPGEPLDEFRFRCAHAGALLAISWLSHQDTTVTPLPLVEPVGEHPTFDLPLGPEPAPEVRGA